MNLIVSRSETTVLRFQRKTAAGEVITELPDEIYFSVKKRLADDETVLQKRLTTGGIQFSQADYFYYINISVGDMDAIPEGTYYCDVKRVVGGEEKFILPATALKVAAVVTRLVNEEEDDG